MSVWDPEFVLEYKHTGSQAADAEWVSSPYKVPVGEVLEIYKMEIIPPIDTTNDVIKKLKYITLMIGDKEYETIRVNSVMLPYGGLTLPSVAVPLGEPILHYPITGKVPSITEMTCPKAKEGDEVAVKVVAEEAISQDYEIKLWCTRARGDKIRTVAPIGAVPKTFTLDGDVYGGAAVPISIDTWDELPGGLKQSKPQIFPWITYARNAKDTTPNMWYDFVYSDGTAKYSWQTLFWNLVTKEEAYLVKAVGVIPHANSKSIRLFIEGRITAPEFTTRPLPESNYFPPALFYDMTVNAQLKRAGPKFLKMPFLFHNVKGGIEVIDNGTSIPANGVEVHVYGVKFVLK
jgi:hypothetical protein